MQDPLDYLDWDMACLHRSQVLGDDDELASLALAIVGDTAYVRSLCAKPIMVGRRLLSERDGR
jgi:hypothetical protein